MWIKSLWEFVYGQNVNIKSPKRLVPLRIRIGDQAIIEELINIGFDETYLVRLNRVRNRLKILYTSNTTGGNGKIIKRTIFNSQIDQSTKIQYVWKQEQPSKKTVRYEQ